MSYPVLVDALSDAMQRHRSHRAICIEAAGTAEPPQITCGDLEAQSDAVAAGLEHWGIRPGDHVVILSKPRPEWVSSFLGILKAGAVAIPIDPLLRKTEIHRLVSATDAVGVIVAGDVYASVSGLATQELTVVLDLDDADLASNGDFLKWDDFIADQSFTPREREPDDLAAMLCTSGTMGDAKSVMLSNENITSNVQAVFERLHVTSDDVMVTIAPWNHSFGLVVLIATLWKGGTVVYTNDYANLADVTARHQATVLVAVPKLFHSMYERLTARIDANRWQRMLKRIAPRLVGRTIRQRMTGGRLRFFVSGSAPLAPEVATGFRNLGIGVIEGYGLTETAPVICFSDAFTPKVGTVGPPMPNVEAKLTDANEEGIGELLVRGPNVMQGYYRNERRTREILDEDGWLHTGDLAYIDEDGWIYIKGRCKNVIVLETGKNVYPEEIEWELLHSPYIQEIVVRQAERKGQDVIQALVYPNFHEAGNHRDEDELRTLIWNEIRQRNRHLATYKRIKSEQDVILVDEPFEKTTLEDVKRYLYQDRPPN
ncbi:MAG: long-chain fatty acid--CoA ligase [Candidatus Bipolaricaulia bacterium]